MSRVLNGTSHFGTIDSAAPVTGYPCTMAAWVKLTTTGTIRVALNVNRTNDSFNFHYFTLGCSAANPPKAIININASTSGASETTISTTATFSTNTWTHLCGVFASTGDCRVYINGTNKVSGTTAHTPTTLLRTNVGAWKRRVLDTFNYWPGTIGTWAIWSAALTDDEVWSLGASKWHPKKVRPESLGAGADWWGNSDPEPSWNGVYNMSVTGMTKDDAIPLIFPRSKRGVFDNHVTASASGTTRLVYGGLANGGLANNPRLAG